MERLNQLTNLEELFQNSKNQSFEVPCVNFALVHLTKTFDLAMIGQTVISTGHVHVDLVGQTLDFEHPKVVSKLKSWNIEDPIKLFENKTTRYDTIDELKKKNNQARLIGTIVEGGSNPFLYNWQNNDIIVIGGANGLSKQDIEKMDSTITIPMIPEVKFLTVSTVVASLTYHILTNRGLWNKFK